MRPHSPTSASMQGKTVFKGSYGKATWKGPRWYLTCKKKQFCKEVKKFKTHVKEAPISARLLLPVSFYLWSAGSKAAFQVGCVVLALVNIGMTTSPSPPPTRRRPPLAHHQNHHRRKHHYHNDISNNHHHPHHNHPWFVCEADMNDNHHCQ